MAGGGTWQTQNKVRPGAYINVVGVPKALAKVGERGTVAIVAPLDWGDDVIEVYASELLNGSARAKTGCAWTDSAGSIGFKLRLALQGANKAVIVRTNGGGDEAEGSVLLGTGLDLTATAKKSGTFGNRITVSFDYDGYFITLITKVDGSPVSSKKFSALPDGDEFVSLEWPELSASFDYETLKSKTITLSGGTNGAEAGTRLSDAIEVLSAYSWQTLVLDEATSSEKAQLLAAVRSWRENEGKSVQAVVADYDADYEGLITIAADTSYRLSDGSEVDENGVCFTIAGMTAGASNIDSLTASEIVDAVELIDGPRKNAEIENALNAGKLVLSTRDDGVVIVEKDINSLHTFTPTKGYIFSKQRPLRVMDQYVTDIRNLWVKSYQGKVSNNDDGRAIFKGDICAYSKQLQQIGAIQNFDTEDVVVSAGDDVDSVVAEAWIQPVDSAEKLYLKLNVEG